MAISWWWLWMIFMFFFFVTPVGYGWGYRRWGPPYPRYIQRRRSRRAGDIPDSAPFDHHAWGWGGDFVWLAFFIGMLWVVTVFWWR
jgi:hypothetical protein